MRITIVPASPRTAQATIRALLADTLAPTIRGVYRNLARVPDEFKSNPCFEAVQGDIEDAASLDFSGSDVVFVVPPPIFDDRDTVEHTKVVCRNVKDAVQKAGVKKLVLLSSVGGQYSEGVGEILTNHTSEVVLRDAASQVVILRPSYFMDNWAPALETIPDGYFYTYILPVDLKIPHVAFKDIGETAAKELLSTAPLKESPYVFEIHGPEYSSLDVQRAWEEASGKNLEMRTVEKEGLEEYFGVALGPVRAGKYAEMMRAVLPGGVMYENPEPVEEVKKVGTELLGVFREMLGAGAA